MPRGFLIGVTDKAVRLDERMKAVFQEFIIESGPDKFEVPPEAEKAVGDHFTRIWKDIGQPMTPLKLTILSILIDEGPLQMDDLFEAFQHEEHATDRKSFVSAIKELLKGDLVTMNEQRMQRPQ